MPDEASTANEPGNYVVLGESTDTVIDGIRHRLVYCAAPRENGERPDAAKDRRMWLVKEAVLVAAASQSFDILLNGDDQAALVLAVAQQFSDWVEEG